MIGIISLIIEFFTNMLLSKNSYLLPLFTLVSLIYIKKDDKYLIKLVILGFIYDLFFTNYYILHIFIFFLIGIFIKRFKNNSVLFNLFLTIIIILIYDILLFIIFNTFKINVIDISDLIFVIKHFFIINIIYSLLLSIIYIIKDKNKT